MPDYEKLEAELDKEIEALSLPDETETSETISADTVQTDTSTVNIEEEPAEEMVPISRYKNAQAAMTRATQRTAELERIVAEMQKPQAETIKEIQEEESNPELDALMSEYPEIVGPLVKRNLVLEKRTKESEVRLKNLEDAVRNVSETTTRVAEIENSRIQDAHVNSILAAHPDAETIVSSPEFEEWGANQPPMIRAALQNGSSADVNLALSLFKKQYDIPDNSASRAEKLIAAKSMSTPSVPKSTDKAILQKPQFTREQIKKMSMKQFGENEAAIDEMLSKGLFA